MLVAELPVARMLAHHAASPDEGRLTFVRPHRCGKCKVACHYIGKQRGILMHPK